MDLEALFQGGFPVVEGTTLRLRGLAAPDRQEVFELYADKEAVRYGYSPKMEGLADAEALVAETRRMMEARTLFHWGVARRADDRIIGHATLFDIKTEHRRAEIGYSVVKSSWGLGLGTEAAGLLLEFAFERAGLRRMEADVDPRNLGSIRVLEKHGFVREGLMRERWELGGEIQDGIFYGLLRKEWEENRRGERR